MRWRSEIFKKNLKKKLFGIKDLKQEKAKKLVIVAGITKVVVLVMLKESTSRVEQNMMVQKYVNIMRYINERSIFTQI